MKRAAVRSTPPCIAAIASVGGLLYGLVLSSIAGAEARRLIRSHLDALGWVETRDYVCAA